MTYYTIPTEDGLYSISIHTGPEGFSWQVRHSGRLGLAFVGIYNTEAKAINAATEHFMNEGKA